MLRVRFFDARVPHAPATGPYFVYQYQRSFHWLLVLAFDDGFLAPLASAQIDYWGSSPPPGSCARSLFSPRLVAAFTTESVAKAVYARLRALYTSC